MSRKRNNREQEIPSNKIEGIVKLPYFKPLNKGQAEAIAAIANPDNVVTILDGVAGSGKTFLAVSWALKELLSDSFKRIILTRPVVEAAGEKLGFLPGDFDSKIKPYMCPLFDMLSEYLSIEELQKMKDDGKLETRPMAYMRGSTFKDSVIILDEAQNTNIKQMQMFLTRIGSNSKIIIAGDRAQSDLYNNNGFTDAVDRLKSIKGLCIVNLDESVRHPMVQEIIACYENGLV